MNISVDQILNLKTINSLWALPIYFSCNRNEASSRSSDAIGLSGKTETLICCRVSYCSAKIPQIRRLLKKKQKQKLVATGCHLEVPAYNIISWGCRSH